uniref:ATP synthase subunit b', chloroplastic n=1 Tax=Anthurium amnicola TaxID=1678845 RepID=A0A1D1Y0B6_9ARAE
MPYYSHLSLHLSSLIPPLNQAEGERERPETMASAVMASTNTPSRTLLSPVACTGNSRTPKQQQAAAAAPNRFQQLKLAVGAGRAAAAGLVAAAAWGSAPAAALAAEIEKAALFDFNLTLPAIAAEFLLLMVALDKVYFTPLGRFMDERDAAIRAQLADVKDTSGEVRQLEEQAAAVMKAARAEISAALNQMKKETTAELEQKLAEGRRRVEAELAEALANLERQKEETIAALDSQIAALSDEIVKKVLPTL